MESFKTKGASLVRCVEGSLGHKCNVEGGLLSAAWVTGPGISDDQ